MIKLEGWMYGEKTRIVCEHPYTCAEIQVKLKDVFDRTSQQGCPEKCPYVIRGSSGPLDHIKFVCDVIIKEDKV